MLSMQDALTNRQHSPKTTLFAQARAETWSQQTVQHRGTVRGIRDGCILALLPHAALGQVCRIKMPSDGIGRNKEDLLAEVVGFGADEVVLAPYGSVASLERNAEVVRISRTLSFSIPARPLGIAFDALGRPLRKLSVASMQSDHSGRSESEADWIITPFEHTACPLFDRIPITTQMATGIRAIDTLTPIGRGQRMGIFSGPGLGKSSLLGMIARHSDADVIVIAMVGERGREVHEFVRDSLGEEGAQRAVLVVSTSDDPASLRRLAPYTATAIAERFRREGRNVLLLVDSLTRTARALRELGMARGEIPMRGGLTSSIYRELPQLLERAGNDQFGLLTAFYTVLTEDDGDIDPLGEEVKSLLDGHLLLHRDVASRGMYPAIRYTSSISRLMGSLLNEHQAAMRSRLLKGLSRLENDKDLALLGGVPDPQLQRLMKHEDAIIKFLSQLTNDYVALKDATEALGSLLAAMNALV